jgi:flagellar biosynthesis/type III secretory pathway protein FliH
MPPVFEDKTMATAEEKKAEAEALAKAKAEAEALAKAEAEALAKAEAEALAENEARAKAEENAKDPFDGGPTASLFVCNLVAGGMTVAEALAEEAKMVPMDLDISFPKDEDSE